MLQCQVNFLDDTHFMWELERNAVGRDLFNKVCEHLDLLERDYYGLAMWDSPYTRGWLDCSKEILKQIKGPVAEFFFNIKFYPPDPSILAEDITRYHLCLQLRKDIMIGRLPCPSDMLALLGSYTVQSTLGDYDPNLHKNNYVSEIVLAPNQSEELDEKVMEQHATHRSLSPAQADMLFFEYAKTLPMYGVDLHPAKDVSGADVMLGVCSEGLMVFKDEIKTNSFSWPRVLKISHKRNTFLLKIRSSEDELDGDVSFTLPSYRACKQLWKCSVENHSFYRNRLQDTTAKRFLTLGSRFRYSGRTLSECLEASTNITRAPPQFLRLATKRKANEEILNVLKQPVQTESDDWFLVHDSDKWEVSSSDDVMLESKELWESKQEADDWFVLLESSLSPPSVLQQFFETEEQRKVEIVEENESEERTTDELVIKRSYKVNVAQEGPVELKVMEELARDIMKKEHPELKEQIMTMKESLTEEILQVNGERIQRVVITKQWTQEVNTFVESQEDVEKKIEVGKLLSMGSEKTSERLEIIERKLQEVETIEQKLLDVEVLRVGLQEIESLEQRLQRAEREELQQAETADWYILLDPSPSLLTAAPTAEEQININKPMARNDDWYILVEMPAQRIKLSASPTVQTDVIGTIAGVDQAEEVESKEAEKKIQLLPPDEPKTHTCEETSVELYEETREEVTQSRVRIDKEQVTVDYRRPQPVLPGQQADRPQRDLEDDWFILSEVSPKTSVSLAYPYLRGATVELYEESREEVLQSGVRREEQESEPIMLEKRATQAQRDVEDDWFIILDVSPKGTVPLVYPHLQSTTIEPYEKRVTPEKVEYKQQQQVTVEDSRPQQVVLEQRAAQTQRDVELLTRRGGAVEVYEESREDRVTEVMTVSTGQTVITEKKSVVQTPEFPVVPREVDDDWFQLFNRAPYEQSIPSGARFVSLTPLNEEKRAVERRRDEVQKKQQERVTVDDRRPVPIILEHRAAQVQREREDDWSIILDVSPKASVPTTVEVYEESRETRVRKEERVTEVMTVSTGQTVRTEKMMVKVVQTPQVFPVVPREIDDDWFQMFDPVPYEQRSITSDVKSRDVVVREPTKDQRVQRIVERVVEEQIRGKTVLTEERRVVFEERSERVDVVQQMFPVRVRQVDDDWCELLDPTAFEKRAVLSVDTEKQRIKEQEDRRVRQQDRRVRDDVETRMRQQEMRKLELEVRRSQPAVIVQTVAQSQREVEEDWFVVFDVSPKQTVVADVIKVDKRGEEVKRREEEKTIEDKRRKAEQRRREEERRRQIQVEDRHKIPVGPEKTPVWQQREREDDWFNLMGVSSKDSVSTRVPVISPVAVPKPRPQIPADQPLTSTPTIQPVSVTKTTYRDRTKDTLDIALESEAEDSVLMGKSRRWTKRIEGESIYVRHSILMLEVFDDFDVTQEVVLRHQASISELKRVFMEAMQDFGPTEWDRRLSSYSPMPKTQLPHANGDILISMGLIEDGGKTVV
ncbi:erythrocyte membrane protein band 4.1b elliptocytosis 1 [Triplophysa rosa]|uniref:Protein 4.1 n=1 Tax=Triplophysa rosa TaxID=992332 RepID=A0A9W7WQU4_TRIRA|nr:erythrocyte membrane protein band 4.1b elliptocytosis 1 [Triplophysa rosa]